jgi:hypothetical protein
VSDDLAAEAFGLARFVLRLTFVILAALGLAVSAYAVPALPFATLAIPACALLVLAFSTRLARFVAGSPESPMSPKAREVSMLSTPIAR